MLIPEDQILNARILAVDDNPVNVALLRDMLEAEGFTGVETTTDPVLALERLGSERFDLLLLDIRMPVLDGHEVMARLPELVNGYLPVIVLTAQTDAETRMRALGSGARDFISKPFDMTEAAQRIRNALEAQLLYSEHRDNAAMLEREVRKRTAELAHMATHDPITSLPNRAGLRDVLDAALGAGEAGQLLFLAVDGMGVVNDSLGHVIGEQLVSAVGQRLKTAFPVDTMIAAWGSAEFVIVLPDDDDLSHWATLAESLFAEPFSVADNELVLSCAIGSCTFPDNGDESDLLIRRAGLAVFFARQRGLSHCRFVTELEDNANRRNHLERELRGATERGEMQVYYQPKVSLPDLSIVGMEALLRWFHPELGFVSPVHFIPVAEETGSVVAIGEWVMQQACADTKEWHKQGYDNLVVAVNVSGRQFEAANLPGMIKSCLDSSGLPAANLEIEITETALMRDMDRARKILGALRDLGVTLAIDDFGTGYSSLAYLRHLSIDTLKIDQSFVRDLALDHDDQAIVRAILVMARSLGLTTVAEGIETPFHMEFLRTLGCTFGQGYLFAKPMPAKDFSVFLKNPILPELISS